MKFFCIILLYLIGFTASAQQMLIPADTLPDHLKKNASVIKHAEEVYFEVLDVDRAHYSVYQELTVLSKEGASAVYFSCFTNKFISIDDVDIRITDMLGGQIARYRKKDMIKQARNAEFVEDGMYNYIPVSVSHFPVKATIRYRLNYGSTFFFPPWEVAEPRVAVLKSSFTVKVPTELGIRYKAVNTKITPASMVQGNATIYQWTATNIPPLDMEEGTIERSAIQPSIVLAPNKFKIYNTYGDMSSWKKFGEWEQKLSEGLDILPEERRAFFAEMVKDAGSEEEKIRRVYRYLQDNFRYVSIQLGIGGYKPFPAKFTDEKKYGDCKALSFYMHSVLKSLGIRSHVALINSRYNGEPADPSFPLNSFNHMILCVPQAKDTIWLECTSKVADFNHLGSDTENRNALLVTDNGGVLVSTPKSRPEKNSLSRFTEVHLKEDGSGNSKTIQRSRGDIKGLMEELLMKKKDDQKEMLVHWFGFRQPDDFSLSKKAGKEVHIVEIEMAIEKIPQFSTGSKMFLSPRIIKVNNVSLPKAEGRKYDYFFPSSFDRTDTTVYQLPEGFVAEALPPARQLACDFAVYSSGFEFNKDKNQLICVARLTLKENRIPVEKYAEVHKFFGQVMSEESLKIVVKKI